MLYIRRMANEMGLFDQFKKLFEPDDQGPVRDRSAPFLIPILLLNYFPVSKGRIDQAITGDVNVPLETIHRHTVMTTQQVVDALETGSTYHGYKDPTARPSLSYQVVDTLEFLEPLPTFNKPGHSVPMTDYSSIMERIDIRRWVEERGIKEVWLWGYHGGVIDLWESNMAGPYGDISNSDRDPYDLPVLDRTYTVYHYNYQRGPSEAVEDHLHQIEAILRHVDSRLFWDKFVGKSGEGHCGWSHYPPNGSSDYDWANSTSVWTDIEDWTPEGTGLKQRMDCTRWGCDSLQWFIYWMQNLPGANNGLSYRGRLLKNWWAFIGEFDEAMSAGRTLTH